MNNKQINDNENPKIAIIYKDDPCNVSKATQYKMMFKCTISMIAHDRYLYMVVAVISIISALSCYFSGSSEKLYLFAYLSALRWLLLPTVLIFLIFYSVLLAVLRVKSPLGHIKNKIMTMPKYLPKVIPCLILLSVLSIEMSGFSSMKALIPLINPFHFDLLFHQLDFWIFAGHEPWYLVMGVWHTPYITEFLNFNYNFWFILLWWILLYFVFMPQNLKRSRYLISWVLCWFIVGNVLALVLSSAGPAFAFRLDPNNQSYVPLMKLLNHDNAWLLSHHALTPVWALGTQNDLWNSYTTGKEMLGSGISAMPSMHVSMAVLMALGVSSLNKKLGYLMWIFAFFIYIGSFSLGWHYAVDGLVSAPVTYAIWWVTGRVLKLNQEIK